MDTLTEVFCRALALDSTRVTEELAYGTIPEWDSTAHMMLVADIEATFDVMLDTDDIIDMSSVAKAREILAKYQG